MSLQGSMTVERMCELARVSRASFYRSLKEQRPAEEETEVRSTIQQIALEHRRSPSPARRSEDPKKSGIARSIGWTFRPVRRVRERYTSNCLDRAIQT
jgi:hypothetical protein